MTCCLRPVCSMSAQSAYSCCTLVRSCATSSVRTALCCWRLSIRACVWASRTVSSMRFRSATPEASRASCSAAKAAASARVAPFFCTMSCNWSPTLVSLWRCRSAKSCRTSSGVSSGSSPVSFSAGDPFSARLAARRPSWCWSWLLCSVSSRLSFALSSPHLSQGFAAGGDGGGSAATAGYRRPTRDWPRAPFPLLLLWGFSGDSLLPRAGCSTGKDDDRRALGSGPFLRSAASQSRPSRPSKKLDITGRPLLHDRQNM
mmetsp:Transcript_41310/g.108483  ORF Transcript_41310/g.108483 Transcript_41310/m.108483 type:complete len:259 (-) Transcript_41310:9-785(-)